MLAFQTPNNFASTSGVKPKRKRAGSIDGDDESAAKHLRIQPPQYDGFLPDLVPDMTTSTTASDSDAAMDRDMDFDMDDNLDTPYAATTTESSYCYAESGSGGFGFGPGAEEDEMSDDGSPKGGYAQLGVYPHDATHPNPHHFTNVAPYTSYAQPAATSPTTPWNATGPNGYGLGFTAPQPSAGLMQPTQGVALGPDASAVDRARNAHGPHCTSIPQLRMSDYPDANGVRSLWSMCPDCGALERTS